MMDANEKLRQVNVALIAEKGAEIYGRIKDRYEPKDKGKFLAIEVDSENVYFGETSLEAVGKAKSVHPDKVFYLVKIGFDTMETIAKMYYPD